MNRQAVFFALGIALCSVSGCSVGPILEKTSNESQVSSVSAGSYKESVIKSSSTVYFAYDKYNLGEESLREARKIAAQMKKNTSLRIRVEGHCDERGTREYNLALGEKRANAISEILILNGVSSRRVNVVSYGEERPVSPGSNETSWSKKRRAVLKIY